MARKFDCDPRKREWLVRERDLDPLDMIEVFEDGQRLEDVDSRFDYGEERRITIGRARGKVFTVVFTQRGSLTWIITAWPASLKERERYARR